MSRPENIRVEYHVEATVNLGDFQNVRPGYTLGADVPADEHPSNVRAKLKALADEWLEQDIDQYRSEARS